MAGLMTEAIARAADREWKETLAAERAAMLEALERIKPQLERLAVGSAGSVARPENQPVKPTETRTEPLAAIARPHLPVSQSSAKSGRETVCPECGYQFGQHELFLREMRNRTSSYDCTRSDGKPVGAILAFAANRPTGTARS